MKKFNLLGSYPNPKNKRYVSENLRTIKHRIIASYRGKEFYDGKRIFGYGGFKYDGRWKIIADRICKRYNLNNDSSILQLSSKKGLTRTVEVGLCNPDEGKIYADVGTTEH